MIEILKNLPPLMMWLSLVSGVIYFILGDKGQGVYWLSAGALNFSVIYLIPRGI